MKILMISKSLPFSYKGGIQTHTWELSKSLMKMGYHVTILTAGNRKNPNRSASTKDPDIKYLPFIPGKFMPGIRHTVEELSFNLNVFRWVKKNQWNFDLIHAQGRSGSMLHYPSIQVPVIYTIHRLNNIENKFKSHRYSSLLDQWMHQGIFSSFERNMIKKSNELITVSDQSYQEITASCAA